RQHRPGAGAETRPGAQGARGRLHREGQQGGVRADQDGHRRREVFRRPLGRERVRRGQRRTVQAVARAPGGRGGNARGGAAEHVGGGEEVGRLHQFLESAGIALRAIWEYKLRSFLTVLGNIVAVTSIIAVVALVQGMNAYVADTIETSVGVDNFTIQRMPPIRTQADEDRVRNNPRIKLSEATAIKRFSDNVGAIAAQANAAATMSFRGESVDGAQVMGVSPEYINF